MERYGQSRGAGMSKMLATVALAQPTARPLSSTPGRGLGQQPGHFRSRRGRQLLGGGHLQRHGCRGGLAFISQDDTDAYLAKYAPKSTVHRVRQPGPDRPPDKATAVALGAARNACLGAPRPAGYGVARPRCLRATQATRPRHQSPAPAHCAGSIEPAARNRG